MADKRHVVAFIASYEHAQTKCEQDTSLARKTPRGLASYEHAQTKCEQDTALACTPRGCCANALGACAYALSIYAHARMAEIIACAKRHNIVYKLYYNTYSPLYVYTIVRTVRHVQTERERE